MSPECNTTNATPPETYLDVFDKLDMRSCPLFLFYPSRLPLHASPASMVLILSILIQSICEAKCGSRWRTRVAED